MLVEKLFLQFVAINFHEKALADRLEENRKGLKALDRLSNAQPMQNKKSPYGKRGHKSASASVDLFGISHRGHTKVGQTGADAWSEKHDSPAPPNARHVDRQRKRKKPMTSVIVDQVCFLVTTRSMNSNVTGGRSDWPGGIKKLEIQQSGGTGQPSLCAEIGKKAV